MMQTERTRLGHDLLGEGEVPGDALYGVHTLSAVENVPISGVAISQYGGLIRALAEVKRAVMVRQSAWARSAGVRRSLGCPATKISAMVTVQRSVSMPASCRRRVSLRRPPGTCPCSIVSRGSISRIHSASFMLDATGYRPLRTCGRMDTVEP